MARWKVPYILDAIVDHLLGGAAANMAFDPDGLLDSLKKALAERVLNTMMDHHLACEAVGNTGNGYGRKMVAT